MDWSPLLFWLILGLLIGWLIEFFIDYFFWQRKCKSSTTAAAAALATSQKALKGMEAELADAQAVRTSLEANTSKVQDRFDDVMGRIGLLAGAGGALGAIGGWLDKGGDDKAFKAQIADVNASLKAKSELEAQVGDLTSKLGSVDRNASANLEQALADLRSRFDMERNAKCALESRLDQLQGEIKASADLDAEVGRLRQQLEAERNAKAEIAGFIVKENTP